jgi:predicted HicB family RNase H-like nuclease
MDKNLEYYMKLPYTTVIRTDENNDGSPCYVASLLELPHCIGVGDTPAEAVEELELHKRMKIETHLEEGFPIPEPPKYTGQFHLRIQPSLHESLARMAELEHVSLNQYIDSLLSRAVGYTERQTSRRKKKKVS